MSTENDGVKLFNCTVSYATPIPESLFILKMIEKYAELQYHPIQPDGRNADTIIAEYLAQNSKK